MGSAVYVWPVHLIGGVYADLHGMSDMKHPFEVLPSDEPDDGTHSQMLTIGFNIDNARTPDGIINVRVTGLRCSGGDSPERSAAIKMVEALRTEYGIFPADYNYIVLSEKRALYNAMSSALYAFRGQYAEMDDVVRGSQQALRVFLGKTTDWLGQDHPKATYYESVAVAGVHCSLNTYMSEFVRDTIHAGDLVQMLMARDVVPDEQHHLDLTAPMPMVIDWEGSYFLLRTIYLEAITKLPGTVLGINVMDYGEGMFKACVESTAVPYVFWGASASTPIAAKAKLQFAVIKFVNKTLGYDIMDLHHTVRLHQEQFVLRFDHKMQGIWRCGQKLRDMLNFVHDLFGRNAGDLMEKLSENPSSAFIRDAVEVFEGEIVSLKERFDECWGRFVTSNVDRQVVQASLG